MTTIPATPRIPDAGIDDRMAAVHAGLAEAAAWNRVFAAGETTHLCPQVDDGGLMPCCGQTPFEVPRTDRITEDPALVTCSVRAAAKETGR